MKIKLDENLGGKIKQVFTGEGHDVHTVHEEGLSGCADMAIFQQSQVEGRVLVTLDHDFGNLLRFPYEVSCGFVILENPEPADHSLLVTLCRKVARQLHQRPIEGRLWIAQPWRIRERPAWIENQVS